METETGRLGTVSDVYPSRWLHVDDLAGRQVTVTIAAVEVGSFRQRDGTYRAAVVLTFERATKALILNKGQAQRVAAILGTERLAEWAGRRLTLAPGTGPTGKPTIAITEAPDARAA